ncbi:hypothetical protein GQX73_g10853 [Xylaria multiplex]|uniref:RGS domain-containing protein n=1 Tax=Xylaria multiplex TaxID=323545 RepID=A0A7C8IGD3_9PEZI|nr:hypothetical protein GQX73_g10853 [Xylaria multiplex]
MGLLPLNYRRPNYVNGEELRRNETGTEVDEKIDASLKSGRSGVSPGIPGALAFDKIINGGTCPPCTVRDFMNYLIYIEHAAENLQFYLWYRDYVRRFSAAPVSETTLSPEWTQEMEEETIATIQRDAADQAKKHSPIAREIFRGTDFEKISGIPVESQNPFSTPPRSSAGDSVSFSGSQATTYVSQAGDAFVAAGAKQPFTIQPFRSEINRVIATYIIDDSPRQLNLSAREQKAVVRALSYTTHPSALLTLSQNIENTLRRQAHPNFIRWTICNGNPARVTFARGLGVGTLLVAMIGSIILTLSKAGRGWRALFAILWVVGIATLITAAKGMCVVLHGLHHRHVRPWELFLDDSDAGIEQLCEGNRSFDSFGSCNNYEDEPWIVRYQRRFYVRKVFDREVWIQEPALRQIQDTIFLQSMLFAVLGAGVLTAVFVAVPAGNLF